MIEIATAIQEGAMAYLRRQFRRSSSSSIPLAVVVFLTSTEVVKPRRGRRRCRFVESGLVPHAGVRGRLLPVGLTGFIGMSLAVRGNVRTAAAAKRFAARPPSRSPSGPAASPACSPSASACSAPPSSS